MSVNRKHDPSSLKGGHTELLLSFLRLTETVLRISLKLVLIFFAGFVALIAALVWKK